MTDLIKQELNEGRWDCTKCPQSFNHEFILRRHVTSEHSDAKEDIKPIINLQSYHIKNETPLCFTINFPHQASSANNQFSNITSSIRPIQLQPISEGSSVMPNSNHVPTSTSNQYNQLTYAQLVPGTPTTSPNNTQNLTTSPLIHLNTSSNAEASLLPNSSNSPTSDTSLPDGSSFYSEEFERKLKRSLPFIKSDPKKRFLNDWSTNTNILQSYPEYTEAHQDSKQGFVTAYQQGTLQTALTKQENEPINEFAIRFKDSNPKGNESESLLWECTACGKLISSKDNLLRHYYEQHVKNQVQYSNTNIYLQDDQTVKNIGMENQGNDHLVHNSENGLQNWKCSQCENCFSQHDSLTKHVKKVHSKNFICELCQKSFPSTYHVTRHMKACSVINNSNQTEGISENEGKDSDNVETKLWNCDQCDRAYVRKEVLFDHVRGKHMQNYNCQSCSKPFSNSYSLRRHVANTNCLQNGTQDTQTSPLTKKEGIASLCINPQQETFNSANNIAAQEYNNFSSNVQSQIKYPITATYYNVAAPNLHGYQSQLINWPPHIVENPAAFVLYEKLDPANIVLTETGKVRKFKCLVCQKMFSERYKIEKHCKRFHSKVNMVPKEVPDFPQQATNTSTQVTKTSATTTKKSPQNSRITPNLKCEFCSNRPTRAHDLKRHTLRMHKKCIDCIITFASKEEVEEHLKTCYRRKSFSPKFNGGQKSFHTDNSILSNKATSSKIDTSTTYFETAAPGQFSESPQNVSYFNRGNSQLVHSFGNEKHIEENEQTPSSKYEAQGCIENVNKKYFTNFTPIISQTVIQNSSVIEPHENKIVPTDLTKSIKNQSLINQLQEAKHKCLICLKTFSGAFTLKRHVDGIHLKSFKCNECKKTYSTNYHLLQHQSNCNQEPLAETKGEQENYNQEPIQQNNYQTINVPHTVLKETKHSSFHTKAQTYVACNADFQIQPVNPPFQQESAQPKLLASNIFPYLTTLANKSQLQITSSNFNVIPEQSPAIPEITIPTSLPNIPKYLKNKPELSIQLIPKPKVKNESNVVSIVDDQVKAECPMVQEEVLDLSIKPKIKTIESSEALPAFKTETNFSIGNDNDLKINSTENLQQIAEGTDQEARKKFLYIIFLHQFQRAAQIKRLLEACQNVNLKANSDSVSIAKVESDPQQTSFDNPKIQLPTSIDSSYTNSTDTFNKQDTVIESTSAYQHSGIESTSAYQHCGIESSPADTCGTMPADQNQESNPEVGNEIPIKAESDIKSEHEPNQAVDDQIQILGNLDNGNLQTEGIETNDLNLKPEFVNEFEVISTDCASTNQQPKQMEETQQCPDCQETFHNELIFARHMKRHHGRCFQCSECPKRFPRKDGLNKHFESQHLMIKYQCHQCSQSFGNKFHLDDHTNGIHNKSQSFACPKCDKSFAMRSQFYRHKYSAHPTNIFSCKDCSIEFKTKHYLEIHIDKVHQ